VLDAHGKIAWGRSNIGGDLSRRCSPQQKLIAAGHKAIAVHCDVADEAQVASMVAHRVSTYGHLDAAFNNAGVQVPVVEAADAELADFDRVNAINHRGVWTCMKHELRQMRSQGSGTIVNCSSQSGFVGIPGLVLTPPPSTQ
jgi:NAD(P)-dependent dehydrogenase (short-subunit alcohol dehydrogenase family)